jgi:hypothetical protein
MLPVERWAAGWCEMLHSGQFWCCIQERKTKKRELRIIICCGLNCSYWIIKHEWCRSHRWNLSRKVLTSTVWVSWLSQTCRCCDCAYQKIWGSCLWDWWAGGESGSGCVRVTAVNLFYLLCWTVRWVFLYHFKNLRFPVLHVYRRAPR